MISLWDDCLEHLKAKVSPQEFQAWLRPLKAAQANGKLTLYAHNQFVEKWVKDKYLADIIELARFLSRNEQLIVSTSIGSVPSESSVQEKVTNQTQQPKSENSTFRSGINPNQNFDNFVQGRSNQLAKSISQQIVTDLGQSHCNPFSLYASTGLGKTHLLHAIGNALLQKDPNLRVLYIHSEIFYRNILKAINSNTSADADSLKKFYRSLDVLMIDDIQFLANKPKVQEEFLHLFNVLLDQKKQLVVTSNIFPKNIDNLDEAIKSRLSWGISSTIEPPELETRVAILRQKAEARGVTIEESVLDFMGQKLRTHVRELEGALNQAIAWQNMTQRPLTIDAVREALRDRFAAFEQLVTIENIQRVVAEYYNIKLSDIKSKSRTQTIARPRQVAMALAKELTQHSLPEIGREFGGRDHTTVMHACKKINELRASDRIIQDDYNNLTRKLSS